MTELTGPFVFDSTDIDGNRLTLRYRVGPSLVFDEVVEFPVDLPDTPEVADAIGVLHLIAGVSYYKLIAPAALHSPPLGATLRRVVEAMYDEGLREFAFRNDIAVPLPVVLEESLLAPTRSAAAERAAEPRQPAVTGRAIIPIGGGKDSALVASLFPEADLLTVNPTGAHERFASLLGRDLVRVRRTLSPELKRLVAEGAPNGHVPVTAINSAIVAVAAAALGAGDILMGLERSASEETTSVDGVAVNHQFSKSLPAEHLLRAVFAEAGLRYFSVLRPLTELAIGCLVARRGLHTTAISCNRVFTVWQQNDFSREQRPCGRCAKCLFTALMTAPALTPDELRDVYGYDVFDEPDNVAGVRELWADLKPFDCVGERLESAAAMTMLGGRPEWRSQHVVDALHGEAASLVAQAGESASDYFTLGPLDDMPEEYRPAVAALEPELRHLAEAPSAAE